MRLTSNWVTERSSQYLIHLIKFSNSKPRNNIEKKNQKEINIYIYVRLVIDISINIGEKKNKKKFLFI